MHQPLPHEPLTSVAAAPRPHSTDQPGEHDRHKGVAPRAPGPAAAAAVGDSSAAAAAGAASSAEHGDGQAAEQPQPQPQPQQQPQQDEDEGDDEPADLDQLMAALERRLAIKDDEHSRALLDKLQRKPVLGSLNLEGVAQYIKSGKAKRIVCMVGAGISVSAGIPDFRTPGTGLYSQLERFGLPEPEAVFSIGFFKKNPKPFHLLAKELFPGNFKPTPAHCFIKLLHDKGLLLRCFSQNIDSLEHQAGLPLSAVVAAHGNFDSAHCIRCGKEHSLEHVKQAVFSDDICHCTKCGSYVKPDIVFFGEQLPDRFYERMEYDLPTADLLLVMGTSLVVNPFASLIDAVRDDCPRVLINRERVGEGMGGMGVLGSLLGFRGGGGFVFEEEEGAYRDVLVLGDADDGVRRLAALLGWEDELDALIAGTGGGGASTAAGGGGGGASSSPAAGDSGSSTAAGDTGGRSAAAGDAGGGSSAAAGDGAAAGGKA